jgi:hypothetical protein
VITTKNLRYPNILFLCTVLLILNLTVTGVEGYTETVNTLVGFVTSAKRNLYRKSKICPVAWLHLPRWSYLYEMAQCLHLVFQLYVRIILAKVKHICKTLFSCYELRTKFYQNLSVSSKTDIPHGLDNISLDCPRKLRKVGWKPSFKPVSSNTKTLRQLFKLFQNILHFQLRRS